MYGYQEKAGRDGLNYKNIMIKFKETNDLCNIEPGDIGGTLILKKMRRDEKI